MNCAIGNGNELINAPGSVSVVQRSGSNGNLIFIDGWVLIMSMVYNEERSNQLHPVLIIVLMTVWLQLGEWLWLLPWLAQVIDAHNSRISDDSNNCRITGCINHKYSNISFIFKCLLALNQYIIGHYIPLEINRQYQLISIQLWISHYILFKSIGKYLM